MCGGGVSSILLLPFVCVNVCCVAAVVKDSVSLSLESKYFFTISNGVRQG